MRANRLFRPVKPVHLLGSVPGRLIGAAHRSRGPGGKPGRTRNGSPPTIPESDRGGGNPLTMANMPLPRRPDRTRETIANNLSLNFLISL